MKKVKYIGDEKFLFGIKELSGQLGFDLCEEGKAISCRKEGQGIDITVSADGAEVRYGDDCEFFRAFSLALQHIGDSGRLITVRRDFSRIGIMLNCSTKVLSVGFVKEFIRQCALMGYNYLQLYTETSYEVLGEPYFGHMKGRYSRAELKEIVCYAKKFCIEVMPCIQTLGHMQELFKWNDYYEVKDIERVMLVDYKRTYQLIENMLKTLSEVFETDRINLGMDEAYFMGLGRYHWFVDPTKPDMSMVFIRHLKRVIELAAKYGFTKPAIWYDNLFEINYKGYINPPVWLFEDFPQQIREAFPKVQMIFWNYVIQDKYEFSRIVKMIRQLSPNVSFASMAHGYTSFAPENYMTERLVETARSGCLENGIDDILITWWGHMQSPLALLPSFYNYIEKCGAFSGYDFEERCRFLFGYSYTDFKKLDLPNILDESQGGTGMAEGNNPPFYIMADDPLLGIMSRHIPDGARELYLSYAQQLESLAGQGSRFSYIFEFEAELCKTLAAKCDLSKQIKAAYDVKDRKAIAEICLKIPQVIEQIERFHAAYDSYWRTFNKTMGWEVFDIRLGGMIMRLKTVKATLEDYAAGRISRIEELEQQRLPIYTGAGKAVSVRDWNFAATTGI